jgi:bifunctional UDP-N-acetylglucosamine pyrophosphorylase/glucosamine-1-phosphate N-acetyltransferase
VKRGSTIGAGSTITKDVPEGALAISRSKQKTIRGWKKRKAKGK